MRGDVPVRSDSVPRVPRPNSIPTSTSPPRARRERTTPIRIQTPPSTTSTPPQRQSTEQTTSSNRNSPVTESVPLRTTRTETPSPPGRNPSEASSTTPLKIRTEPSRPNHQQQPKVKQLAAIFENRQRSVKVPSPQAEEARLTISRSGVNLAKAAENFGPILKQYSRGSPSGGSPSGGSPSGGTSSGGSPPIVGKIPNRNPNFPKESTSPIAHQPKQRVNQEERPAKRKRVRSSALLFPAQKSNRAEFQKGTQVEPPYPTLILTLDPVHNQAQPISTSKRRTRDSIPIKSSDPATVSTGAKIPVANAHAMPNVFNTQTPAVELSHSQAGPSSSATAEAKEKAWIRKGKWESGKPPFSDTSLGMTGEHTREIWNVPGMWEAPKARTMTSMELMAAEREEARQVLIANQRSYGPPTSRVPPGLINQTKSTSSPSVVRKQGESNSNPTNTAGKSPLEHKNAVNVKPVESPVNSETPTPQQGRNKKINSFALNLPNPWKRAPVAKLNQGQDLGHTNTRMPLYEGLPHSSTMTKQLAGQTQSNADMKRAPSTNNQAPAKNREKTTVTKKSSREKLPTILDSQRGAVGADRIATLLSEHNIQASTSPTTRRGPAADVTPTQDSSADRTNTSLRPSVENKNTRPSSSPPGSSLSSSKMQNPNSEPKNIGGNRPPPKADSRSPSMTSSKSDIDFNEWRKTPSVTLPEVILHPTTQPQSRWRKICKKVGSVLECSNGEGESG